MSDSLLEAAAKGERRKPAGVWPLEQPTRGLSAHGCDSKATGRRDDYRAPMDEAHGIKTERAAAHRGHQLSRAPASIGM